MEVSKAIKVVIAYLIFIFILSVVPVKQSRLLEYFPWDKVVHFIFYVILAYLLLSAFRKTKHPYVNSFICAFCFGCFIELVQYFIPYRSFDLKDIAADTIGLAAGLWLSSKIRFKKLSH